MKLSPLFWPIQLKQNTLYVLDETCLPYRMSYIKVQNYLQACSVIKEMKTRAVGQVILVFYTFVLEIRKHKNKKNLNAHLHKVARALNLTRPTLSFRYLTDMVLAWQENKFPLEERIMAFLETLKNKRIQQAEVAGIFLKNSDVVLTHCNVSGLLPLIAGICRQQNKEISFFVTETRPYLQGARLSAWELERAGFDVTVIADNMVAQVMLEGKVNKVMVGADHLAANGDIANKIGTYQIALLAKNFGIPFYVLCPPPSQLKTGRDIPIEIRPEKELLEFNGIPITSRGVKGYYPAFDITPAGLITKHIHLEINR